MFFLFRKSESIINFRKGASHPFARGTLCGFLWEQLFWGECVENQKMMFAYDLHISSALATNITRLCVVYKMLQMVRNSCIASCRHHCFLNMWVLSVNSFNQPWMETVLEDSVCVYFSMFFFWLFQKLNVTPAPISSSALIPYLIFTVPLEHLPPLILHLHSVFLLSSP